MVAHTCKPSTGVTKTQGLWIQGQLGYTAKPISINNLQNEHRFLWKSGDREKMSELRDKWRIRKCDRTVFQKERIIILWYNMEDSYMPFVTRRYLSRKAVYDAIPTHDLLEEEDVAGWSQWLWGLSEGGNLWQWNYSIWFSSVCTLSLLLKTYSIYPFLITVTKPLTWDTLKERFILAHGRRDARLQKGTVAGGSMAVGLHS